MAFDFLETFFKKEGIFGILLAPFTINFRLPETKQGEHLSKQ